MRIFLTGSTGYIGSAVLDSLVRAGHQVTALVRDTNRGKHVAARGATPAVADLGDVVSWHDAAAAQDAWIHIAVEYTPRGPEVDRVAVETILAAARARAGSAPTPTVIYTSGVWVLGSAPTAIDESAPVNAVPHVAWRAGHERIVLDANGPDLRTVVIRPGIVYGGSRGIVADLFRDGANGLIRVVGDGSNHWPLVYDHDVAELYSRILTTPSASGIFHATDDGDVRLSEVVEAIARAMKTVPDVRHIPLEEARAKMGAYADAIALDQRVRSTRARAIGWAPTLRTFTGNVPRLFEEWRANRES